MILKAELAIDIGNKIQQFAMSLSVNKLCGISAGPQYARC